MKIVPTYRLIVVSFVPVIISLGSVFHEKGGTVLALSLAALGGFALWDLVLLVSGRNRVHGSLPAVVRLTSHGEGRVDATLRREGSGERDEVVSLGIPWPVEIESRRNPLEFIWPGGAEAVEVSFEVSASRRGLFPVKSLFLQQVSLFGLWHLHRELPVQSEVRVYPPLSAAARRMAARFLTSGRAGLSVVRLLGQGREFERLRDYLPGDSYSDIDWKATARRRKPVTRLYQAEHTQKVLVAIDTGRLSARRRGEDPVLDSYINAALFLGQIAQKNGDHFGVLTFSDRVSSYIRPGSGKAHINACREMLCRQEQTFHSPAFDELFAFLRLHLSKRTLVLVLTDLDDPLLSEKFLNHVDVAIKRHLVHVCMPRPEENCRLFDRQVGSVDEIYNRVAGDLMRYDLEVLRRELSAKGVFLKLTEPGNCAVTLVNQYLEVKQRQLL